MKNWFRLVSPVVLFVFLAAGIFTTFEIRARGNAGDARGAGGTEEALRIRNEVLRRNLAGLLVLLIPGVLYGIWTVRRGVIRPAQQIAAWLKDCRRQADEDTAAPTVSGLLAPMIPEMRQLVRSLSEARSAALEEARLRLSAESVWTAEKLKEHVRNQIGTSSLFLVSNREPYRHVRLKQKVECVVPPSGLVSALEPVMRACGGLWLAHGSGDADRESSDQQSKVRVPPHEPAYTLKRVWLTKEEENGHYYGFCNEGLWPLCHISHIRPIFRLEDWMAYQTVNEKFLQSLMEELEGVDGPLVLIQDYHFALLPALIKRRRPDARVALFWHIPWPNPESFAICPWKREIISGMLSADMIGFHIQFHCNNFLNTVDETLESKINREQFSVERGEHHTLVRPFPISVHIPTETSGSRPADEDRKAQRRRLLNGLEARCLAVGVDRLDYTKGILERLRAVERFLEKYPQYVGQFTYVELGAPSRTRIQRYQDFVTEVEGMAAAINHRFQKEGWRPVIFRKGQHSHEEILPFYQAADLCLVTSLHDGMNLVAKEFVAARADEDGVLVLSQFTGAARELKDALVVNPYDIESMAESIRSGLEMPPRERRERMARMRAVVRERNVYRWAANLISSMVRLAPERKAAAG